MISSKGKKKRWWVFIIYFKTKYTVDEGGKEMVTKADMSGP